MSNTACRVVLVLSAAVSACGSDTRTARTADSAAAAPAAAPRRGRPGAGRPRAPALQRHGLRSRQPLYPGGRDQRPAQRHRAIRGAVPG